MFTSGNAIFQLAIGGKVEPNRSFGTDPQIIVFMKLKFGLRCSPITNNEFVSMFFQEIHMEFLPVGERAP